MVKPIVRTKRLQHRWHSVTDSEQLHHPEPATIKFFDPLFSFWMQNGVFILSKN